MSKYLNEKNIDNKLKSRMFLMLGNVMRQKATSEVLTPDSVEQINILFDESLKYNNEYHKTWHSYALLNFDAIKLYSE